MTLLVVVCPSCRKARIVEPGRKTAQCAHCSRTLTLADLGVRATVESLDAAREAVGRLNAKYGGAAAGEFESALVPRPRPAERHDGPVERAAARARDARGEAARAEAVARALSEGGAAFTEASFAEALAGAGVPREKAEACLARLVAAEVVFEPAPGRYRVVGA